MIVNSLELKNYRQFVSASLTLEKLHGITMIYGEGASGKTSLMKALYTGFTNDSLFRDEDDLDLSIAAHDTSKECESMIKLRLTNTKKEHAIAKKTKRYQKRFDDSFDCVDSQYTVDPSDFLNDIRGFLLARYICANNDWLHDMKRISSHYRPVSPVDAFIVDAIDGCKAALNALISNSTNSANPSYEVLERVAYLDGIIRKLDNVSMEQRARFYNVASHFYRQNMEKLEINQFCQDYSVSSLLRNEACLSTAEHVMSCLAWFLAQRDAFYEEYEIEPFPILVDGIIDRISNDMIEKTLGFLDDRIEQVFVFAHSMIEGSVKYYDAFHIIRLDAVNSIIR